jgi:hypothetical protein
VLHLDQREAGDGIEVPGPGDPHGDLQWIPMKGPIPTERRIFRGVAEQAGDGA